MTEQYLSWLKDLIEKNDLAPFYQSREFRAVSNRVLKEQRECQVCKERRLYGPAEIAHHIYRVKEHPELALSVYTPEGERNIIAVCRKCHNEIHFPRRRYVNEEKW